MQRTATITVTYNDLFWHTSDIARAIGKLTEDAEMHRAQVKVDTVDEGTYTVFAVYEEDYQPYATSVVATSPEEAMEFAQAEADEGNDSHVPLVGFQVVEGNAQVVA